MCGRFTCALDPDGICNACQYHAPNGSWKVPKWVDDSAVSDFKPSTNIAPTNYSPVLVSAKHFPKCENNSEVIVRPMMFGLIPSWHKGSKPKMEYSTINCRAETMLAKKTFSVPLKKGRRCVVLAEGFYEWEKPKGEAKQPYLVYLSENVDHFKTKSQHGDEKPVKLLKLAAVFDKWESPEDGPIYSYSIITVDASESLRWLHDRMPAILETEKDVKKWLDFENIDADEAMKSIHPVTEHLVWHPVTKAVGNVAYKDADAVRPIRCVGFVPMLIIPVI